MFGLFQKKPKTTPVNDCVWMSEAAKWQACIQQKQRDDATIFLYWFTDSARRLKEAFAATGLDTACIADANYFSHAGDGTFVFVEHFPMREEEEQIYTKLALPQAVVYSSLDEALFAHFGGDRIIGLMKQMGMNEDEMLQHPFISKSITRAQEKIAQKTTLNISAASQQEWLQQAGI